MDTSTSSPLSSTAVSTPKPFSRTSSECSSPLSELSASPSPPPVLSQDVHNRYPSPVSSGSSSGTQSPSKRTIHVDDIDLCKHSIISAGGPPLAKKRKTMPPKERKTEYLDLMKSHEELTAEEQHQLDKMLKALRKKKKVVVIAGAGISVSAGIPDFRSATGLFATAKTQHKVKASGKHLFDASVYKDSDSTKSFHSMVREMDAMTKKAQPTPFHHLLASLAQEGRLLRLYSQNIDCLDTSIQPLATRIPLNAKGPWPATVQLHGSLEKMVCTKCGTMAPFESNLFEGAEPPLCETCKVHDEVRTAHAGKRSHGIGRLRPRFVLYNEYNPDEEAIGNVSTADLRARPDAVIVVGTTLKVPGTRRLVKELCQVTRGRRDGITMWINVDPEPKGVDFKDCWDLVVKSRCDDVARLAELPPWDCQVGTDYLVSQEQDTAIKERQSKSTLEISIPRNSTSPDAEYRENASPTFKQIESIQGILTPKPSPQLAAVKPFARSKQGVLSFPAATEKDSSLNTTKAQQKRVKVPSGRSRKVKQPTNNARMDLKTTKNVVSESGKKHDKVVADASTIVATIVAPVDAGSLPALRPERKASPETFYIKPEGSDEGATLSGENRSTTPTKSQINRETISPKSMPKGMERLIDPVP